MNVLLVQPQVDPNNEAEWPPIGLGYIATALRRAGHNPHILDYPRMYRTPQQFERIVRDMAPHVVGISVFTCNVRHVRELAQRVRMAEPRAVIVLGGAHPSTMPDRVLDDVPEADFAIAGEGEHPFPMLLEMVEYERRWMPYQIPGLIWRSHGQSNFLAPHFGPSVDDYGIPAWDLMPPLEFSLTTDTLGPSVPIFTSRGCPFRCAFCAANSVSGPKWRRRNLALVFEEIWQLHEVYGCRRFTTYDEGFGSHKATMMEFCKEIFRRPWLMDSMFECGTGMRLDQIDEELLLALKQARFRPLIPFGIESGSERILKLMRKQSNLQLIREKITLLDRMGFHPTAYCILGYPTETREEMEATVRMTLELPFRQASYMTFMPLPGTEATKMLQESGELPADFDYSALKGGAITYAPKGMTLRELQAIRRNAILRFFCRPRILWGMMTSWREIKSMLRRAWRIFAKDRTVKE